MKPAALGLEFARVPAVGRVPGTVLAGIGLAAALLLAGQFDELRQERDRWESRVSDTRRLARRALPQLSPGEAPRPEVLAELRWANGVLDQLSIAWNALFADVEGAVGGDIALLGLQPDARGRSVLVEGEARHLPGLLTFVARLEAAPSLERVHLVSHEVRASDPRRPVAFRIQATWTHAR